MIWAGSREWKLGWELYADYKNYVIPMNSLQKVRVEGRWVRDVVHLPALNGMYQAFASSYTGMLVRDEAWWTRSVLSGNGHNVVYYSAEGQPEGYALYELKDKELVCYEFVFLNESARSALLTFFANHDSK